MYFVQMPLRFIKRPLKCLNKSIASPPSHFWKNLKQARLETKQTSLTGMHLQNSSHSGKRPSLPSALLSDDTTVYWRYWKDLPSLYRPTSKNSLVGADSCLRLYLSSSGDDSYQLPIRFNGKKWPILCLLNPSLSNRVIANIMQMSYIRLIIPQTMVIKPILPYLPFCPF